MPQVVVVLDDHENMITAGSRVLVRAGTTVYDAKIGGTRVQKVGRTVRVDHLSSRLGKDENDKDITVSQVIWIGSGGYWCKADAADVSLRER